MAEYILLVHTDESQMPSDVGADVSSPFQEFMQRNADRLLSGAGLTGRDTATSVRRDASGAVTVTDGVFVESKEVLGGYWIVDVADLDEAIALAKEVPVVNGGVEVRPVAMRS
ncbi:YciI family protein [Humibacter ginsengisoli]